MVNSNCILSQFNYKFMNWKLFIGIDVSKLTIDVTFFHVSDINKLQYKQFENTKAGFKEMLKWIHESFNFSKEEIIFCLENTGTYSLLFSILFSEENYFVWVENPLQIKQSLGIKRGKNDKLDSLAIANYAYRFKDKAKQFIVPSKTLTALKDLEAYRSRLLKAKNAIKQASGELLEDKLSSDFIKKSSNEDVQYFNKKIEQVEAKMEAFIKKDEELKRLFDLVVSVKGIGPQTAIYMLIHTLGFTCFTTSRQFACYCGVAPFEYTSGTSVKKKTRVSYLANKKIKTLLHMCSRSAVRHDPELKAFYERKIGEGKSENCVINMVKNKLIYRVFATVKRGENFMPLNEYQSYKKAS